MNRSTKNIVFYLCLLLACHASAQDRIEVSKIARINWFHGHQKNENIGREKFINIVEEILCDANANVTAYSNASSFKKLTAELKNFSQNDIIRKKILNKRNSTACDVRLEVDVIGDFVDLHRKFTYGYVWKIGGMMNRSFHNPEITFLNLKDAEAYTEQFLNRIPEGLKCIHAPVVSKPLFPKLAFEIRKLERVAFLIDISFSILGKRPVDQIGYLAAIRDQVAATAALMPSDQSVTIVVFSEGDLFNINPRAGQEGSKHIQKWFNRIISAVDNDDELTNFELEYSATNVGDLEDIAGALKIAENVDRIFVVSDGNISNERNTWDLEKDPSNPEYLINKAKSHKQEFLTNASAIQYSLDFAQRKHIPIDIRKLGKEPKPPADFSDNLKKFSTLSYGFPFLEQLAKLSGGKDLGFGMPILSQKEIQEIFIESDIRSRNEF